MAHMPDIAKEAAEAVRATTGWFHHETETTMTQPAPQQQRSFLTDVAGVLGDLASNPLVDQLAQQSLGKYLQPADTALVLALVRSLEAPHVANMSAKQPTQAATATGA